MFNPIEKTDTLQAVSKAQTIRLIDILFLGPYMLYMAKNKKLSNAQRSIFGFFGATTIYYNAKNYFENKKRISTLSGTENNPWLSDETYLSNDKDSLRKLWKKDSNGSSIKSKQKKNEYKNKIDSLQIKVDAANKLIEKSSAWETKIKKLEMSLEAGHDVVDVFTEPYFSSMLTSPNNEDEKWQRKASREYEDYKKGKL